MSPESGTKETTTQADSVGSKQESDSLDSSEKLGFWVLRKLGVPPWGQLFILFSIAVVGWIMHYQITVKEELEHTRTSMQTELEHTRTSISIIANELPKIKDLVNEVNKRAAAINLRQHSPNASEQIPVSATHKFGNRQNLQNDIIYIQKQMQELESRVQQLRQPAMRMNLFATTNHVPQSMIDPTFANLLATMPRFHFLPIHGDTNTEHLDLGEWNISGVNYASVDLSLRKTLNIAGWGYTEPFNIFNAVGYRDPFDGVGGFQNIRELAWVPTCRSPFVPGGLSLALADKPICNSGGTERRTSFGVKLSF